MCERVCFFTKRCVCVRVCVRTAAPPRTSQTEQDKGREPKISAKPGSHTQSQVTKCHVAQQAKLRSAFCLSSLALQQQTPILSFRPTVGGGGGGGGRETPDNRPPFIQISEARSLLTWVNLARAQKAYKVPMSSHGG